LDGAQVCNRFQLRNVSAEALADDRPAQMPQRARAPRDGIIMDEARVSQATINILATRAALKTSRKRPKWARKSSY